MRILTGDIGGTNTRLAVGSQVDGHMEIDRHATFPSQEYAALEDILTQYPPALQQLADAAAFGVAGPVKQGVSRITNLPWEIATRALAERLGLDAVYLLNDLEALAWGIDTLQPEELVCLQTGAAGDAGNRAVIAAGTGLGQAGLYFNGDEHLPFATEGGHTDFAAETARDYRLLQYLQETYRHVSWERLVSGSGLATLLRFVLHDRGVPAPDWLDDEQADPAPRITRTALAGEDEHCVETLRWFVELYGREAGNLALKMNAAGGVYLGGGIAPKILPALQDDTFLQAFLGKGRMRPLLETMTVNVIDCRTVTLKGLTRYALRAARGNTGVT